MFGLPLWQLFTWAVAWLYVASSLWITDEFSDTDPDKMSFSVSKCTSIDKMQSNQQRASLFLHWSHFGSDRNVLFWCKTSGTDEWGSEFDKICFCSINVSCEHPCTLIFCCTDSVALSKLGWVADEKPGCLEWVVNGFSPLYLGARLGFDEDSEGVDTKFVSKNLLFLQVPWDE